MRPQRILIAGYEIGGQMQLLAETMRKRGIEAKSVAFNKDFRGFKNDFYINPFGLLGLCRLFYFFIKALFIYDVFYFFWGVSLLNYWRFHQIDLPILNWFGKIVVVHFRGTDVVNIAYYENLSAPFSNIEPNTNIPYSRPDQLKKIKIWDRYADFILVSTPDLLFVSNRALLFPQVIDLSFWRSEDVLRLSDKRPIQIVHAPTRRSTKGTEYVLLAIEALRLEGYSLELQLIEKLPYDQMKISLENCDIGIDQLLIGWYGKISVELMALGKPVICNINCEYKEYRPDLPIIHADPNNLTEVLRDLINDPIRRSKVGQLSKEYIARHHDVELIVNELLDLYGFEAHSFRHHQQVKNV